MGILAAKRISHTVSGIFFLSIAIALATGVLPPEYALADDISDAEARADAIMERIDDCQSAINNANREIKRAERSYHAAKAAVEQAQAHIDEQEARIEEIGGLLQSLSIDLYKGQRLENPLLEILDAESFAELDTALDSIESIADEEAALVEEAREAREQLERAKRSYKAHAKQARQEKAAAKKARAEAEKLHDDLLAQAARITGEIADAEARRSLAEAVADKAFDGCADMKNPCPAAIISSGFGYRDFDHAFHRGVDLAASEGTPYYAAAAGTVIYATNDGLDNGGAGNWVVIAHGNGTVTKYMHSLRTLVNVGDIVTQGQHIGDVGETGAAFGAHLHFQVEVDGTPVNPERLL